MKYGPCFVLILGLFGATASIAEAQEPEMAVVTKCRAHHPAIKPYFVEKRPGVYSGTVSGRYYEHKTGIRLKPNQTIKIVAYGHVCWKNHKRCVGPLGNHNTWGLRLGGVFYNKSSGPSVFLEGLVAEEFELKFYIPEGRDGEWRESNCKYYSDNSGEYTVDITVTDPPPLK